MRGDDAALPEESGDRERSCRTALVGYSSGSPRSEDRGEGTHGDSEWRARLRGAAAAYGCAAAAAGDGR